METFRLAILLATVSSCLCQAAQAANQERATWTARQKIAGCHLHNLTVPASYYEYLLPEGTRVVAPAPNINVKVCAGSCAFPPPQDSNIKANGMERSILSIGRPYLPEVRCVPTTFLPVALVILTDKGELKIHTAKTLQVGSCGCK